MPAEVPPMDWTKPKDLNGLPELPAELIPETIVVWYQEDEPQGWRDWTGQIWRLARTLDGRWWKRRR